MSPIDDLVPMLKKLRLSGVLNTLELRTKQAVDDSLSHPEFLLRILSDEVERRDAKMLDQRIRRASFEHAKTLGLRPLAAGFLFRKNGLQFPLVEPFWPEGLIGGWSES